MKLEDRRYPRFARRLQAALYDVIIIGLTFFICAIVFAQFELRGELKVGIFVAFIFLLEPVLVSVRGGTIGHSIVGLRVLDTSTNANIGIARSTLRFLAKLILGSLSLIFILVTQRRQALHDLISKSSVIVRHADKFASKDLIREQPEDQTGYVYPSKTRRVLVIVAYVVCFFVLMTILGGLSITFGCMENESNCSEGEKAILAILSLVFFGLSTAALVMGWHGRLFGCKKRPIATA